MSRPRPTIGTANEYDAYFEKAQEFADRFAACDGAVGVLLTGGVARGYAAHFSELDLAVHLSRPHFDDWTQRGLSPFPEGDSWLDGWHGGQRWRVDHRRAGGWASGAGDRGHGTVLRETTMASHPLHAASLPHQ